MELGISCATVYVFYVDYLFVFACRLPDSWL